jgi:DNA-binding response OmpR family regulator
MPGPGSVATIVVCEDDQVTLDLLCDRLASDRFEPLPAGTAEEALRLWLPDGGGPELLRRISEAHWLQTQIDLYLPVIALRPRAKDPWKSQGPDLAADDYLEKPSPTRTSVRASTRSSDAATVASTSRCGLGSCWWTRPDAR